jgi:hypothetical protein
MGARKNLTFRLVELAAYLVKVDQWVEWNDALKSTKLSYYLYCFAHHRETCHFVMPGARIIQCLLGDAHVTFSGFTLVFSLKRERPLEVKLCYYLA